MEKGPVAVELRKNACMNQRACIGVTSSLLSYCTRKFKTMLTYTDIV